MPTNSSLVRGASSLFGVRTDMQFGKLKLSTVVAQKKSSSSSVSSKGGSQLTNFEFSADAYDENRHFFLSHYFRDHYDDNMKQLPNITSGITIKRIEVWVTNKTGATTDTRNIVGFTDLAEHSHISNPQWVATGTDVPSNASNNLYSSLNSSLAAARDISSTTPTLDGAGLVGSVDYEKLESARKLSSSEYTLNTSLGYISLKQALQTDQVLAVAYEYTYKGQTYQVGEFATDRKDNQEALFLKALKNTACTPTMGNWDLMMRNVYSLGATSVQKISLNLTSNFSLTPRAYISAIFPNQALRIRRFLPSLGSTALTITTRLGLTAPSTT